MKTNAIIWWSLAIFYGIVTVVYVLWFYLDNPEGFQWVGGPHSEGLWVGILALGLTTVLSIFIGFFVTRYHNRSGGLLPEDTLDAEIDEGDPNIGHYSPWSWWPIVLAAGMALVFIGLGTGFWLSFYGLPVALIGLVGFVFEHYRGTFQH
ncbi:MAG: cytochrome c oxidase subunit 4 [Microbacteriaceae bacterium]|nr:cytochrome c oxidase subunit 4 [Microbacteriaceae bacterium]